MIMKVKGGGRDVWCRDCGQGVGVEKLCHRLHSTVSLACAKPTLTFQAWLRVAARPSTPINGLSRHSTLVISYRMWLEYSR